MHQTVNLRAGNPQVFGDQYSQDEYTSEVERARAAQTVRYAVAPRQAVTLPNGSVIPAGAEIRLEMFHGHSTDPAQVLLDALVNKGVVIERY